MTPRKRQKNNLLSVFFITLLAVTSIYLGIINFAWQCRNPKANPMTFWTHLNDAVQFKKLPQFQE